MTMVFTLGPRAIANKRAREHVDLAVCGDAHTHSCTIAHPRTGLDDEAVVAGCHHAAEGMEDDLARP